MTGRLLELNNVKVAFETESGVSTALEDISFDVYPKECFGVIGESGSGKSMTAMTIMGCHGRLGAKLIGGSIMFDGTELTGLTEKEYAEYRGKRISIITQNPMTSLDPLFTVEYQIAETIMAHEGIGFGAAKKRARELFSYLGISLDRIESYPFELSGGMLQRILGGIAICSHPQLILADEPTTALDATVQLQYLQFLNRLRREMDVAMILISHDIRVIAIMCSRVAVMYAGRIVEEGKIEDILSSPMHPYTEMLLRSANIRSSQKESLAYIAGQAPKPVVAVNHCAFAERCRYWGAACLSAPPPKITRLSGQYATCWRYSDDEEIDFREYKQAL
jgi:oligopeptide/dipeptide ABC transporter ATP-binding protein